MKIAFDMSSVMWTCLSAGVDKEGFDVEHNGKQVRINTSEYGFQNCMNLMVSVLKEQNEVPINTLLVFEGMSSKQRRLWINKDYKANRGSRPQQQYDEFNKLKEALRVAWNNLGALALSQEQVEGDDVLGWLAKHTEDDLMIVSNDSDLVALRGVNEYGKQVFVRVSGSLDYNKYKIPPDLICVYKSLIGDSVDNIKGVKGFGPVAWESFLIDYGLEGVRELKRVAELGDLSDLGEADSPVVRKILQDEAGYLNSYKLACIHPEWVNTLQNQIEWKPGLLKTSETEHSTKLWAKKFRIVTSDNYNSAMIFLKEKVAESPMFSLDLETSTSKESDEWLQSIDKKNGVDVLDSQITGCSILFGNNMQYSYYMTVDHFESRNITLQQLGTMLQLLDPQKLTVAHNAEGFELPVLFNAFGEDWKDNGWRGFFPNMVDSNHAARYWDENRMSFGLKTLSKDLFDYDQETYAQVTGGLKMNQIPAEKVVSYGCDDVYVSFAIWNFCATFMKLEHTYKPFMRFEQKPMYLQATSYVRGIKVDMARLTVLAEDDTKRDAELRGKLDAYLTAKQWDGTVPPSYAVVDAKSIKECTALAGFPLDTMVRMIPKLGALVAGLGQPWAKELSEIIYNEDAKALTDFALRYWKPKPEFNTGSPKQMQKFLYETLGLPVRLRNKATAAMREKGIREGTARTDEDAMLMAIKQLDTASEEDSDILKSLIEIKSISTRRGLYWEAYPKALHWKTGKIHPQLRQSSTNTRRYTSADPNIQQMDSSPLGVRSVILPHKRNAIVVSLDESAQEVRQMADYSLDPDLLTCYIGKPEELRDVHSIVACKIADCSYEEFRRRLKKGTQQEQDEAGMQRQRAKITLFAVLYGAAAGKIAEGLGISEDEAQSYIDAIFEKFPKVKDWKEATEDQVKEHGWVPIHGGSIRHLAALVRSDDKYVASKAMRQAGNARIQSAGANQIKQVMSDIWDSNLLDHYDYRWYFSVHDETVHSVHKNDAEAVIPILHGFMTKQFLNVVPSKSSIGLGKNFGQLIEIGEDYKPELVTEALGKLFAT
jgi:DNA polymerase I-like protein with 3'-5' exonuclease and polymerase domains/5'-3' exonuclease